MKTRINVVTFNFFVGEIPKEESSKIHWSPIQGALLVAGIQMTGFIPPQELEDNLRFTNCETWRINHFRYVWNKWCSTYDSTCAVTPSDFLEWYEKNPAPPPRLLRAPNKGSSRGYCSSSNTSFAGVCSCWRHAEDIKHNARLSLEKTSIHTLAGDDFSREARSQL